MYSPVSWDKYFERSATVEIEEGERRQVYWAGRPGSLLVLLLHGAGHTSLSWAVCARQMAQRGLWVLATDLRGHGRSESRADLQLDHATLCADLERLLERLRGGQGGEDAAAVAAAGLLLVGHSMGGALAVRLAHGPLAPRVRGVVVVDLVEGTALESLEHIARVLERRPRRFASPTHAVRWAVAQGTPRSAESARVSVPAQLRRCEEEGGDGWTWITDLERTRELWRGWYTGLSDAFLSCPCARLLVLAGTERLDTPLTLAQMQGRFQLVLLPGATGHLVPEDAPEPLARAVADFAARLTAPLPLPPASASASAPAPPQQTPAST
jgi:protein phosphatase methylesterase 1